MHPSFTDLRYFLEVIHTENLSRAAERLGITQPSLSMAIKRLEHTVGTALLTRHQSGVVLTPSGKQFEVHVRQLLNQWQTARSSALASKHEIQGCFTLGCHSTIAIDIVTGFLPSLLEKHPLLEVHLKHDASRRILEQVINFKIDVAILVNPVRHPDLIIKKLCMDEMAFWRTPRMRDIHDFTSGKAIVLCDPDLKQSYDLIQRGSKLGFQIDRVITMNSLEVIAHMVANECGIGVLPGLMSRNLFPGRLQRVPQSPTYKEELCLVYRNEIRQVRAVQIITESIKKYCRVNDIN